MMGVVGGFGASMKGPGHAHHNGMEFLRLGEMDGGLTPRLETVKRSLGSGGFKVLTFDDIHKMVWEKLICNCTYSGPCALTGLRVGELQASPSAWSIAAACAHEAFQVARAKGIKLDFDDPVRYVREFGQKIPGARPSMLLDHHGGAPSRSRQHQRRDPARRRQGRRRDAGQFGRRRVAEGQGIGLQVSTPAAPADQGVPDGGHP